MELISSTKLLPHKAQYLGFASSLILLIYSVLVKIEPSFAVTDKGYLLNILFVISLIVIIGSKSKVEDERVQSIRYYTHSLISGLLVGFILINEINEKYESYLPHLSGVLSLYVLQYIYLYRFSGDWIMENRGKYFILIVMLGAGLILFYRFLWN